MEIGLPRVCVTTSEAASGPIRAPLRTGFEQELVAMLAAFGEFVLREMVNTYQPFVLANGAAQKAGAKAFHADIYGEDVSYLSRAYPETSRRMIVDNIKCSLDQQTQTEVNVWLESKGLRAFS